jgi:hypothetical protein
MFIERAKGNEVPKGAIRLTKDEVVDYMVDLIKKWPNTTELWALKLGNPILASAVVISSTLILNFYRNKLKLKNYGRFTLFIPIVFTPSIFCQIFQSSVTTKSVILQDDCPTCITTQGMFIQLGTGIVYPLLGSIGGSYMFANKMGTYTLKSSGYHIIKECAMHILKTSQPFYNRLTVFVIGHLLLSYAITYYQIDNFELLRFKMYEQQQEQIKELEQSKQFRNKSLNN